MTNNVQLVLGNSLTIDTTGLIVGYYGTGFVGYVVTPPLPVGVAHKSYCEVTFSTSVALTCYTAFSTTDHTWFAYHYLSGLRPQQSLVEGNSSITRLSDNTQYTGSYDRTICFAFDSANGTTYWRNGGTGNWNGTIAADPVAGTGGIAVGAVGYPMVLEIIVGSAYTVSQTVATVNFGPNYQFSVPTGFTGWNGLTNAPPSSFGTINALAAMAGVGIRYTGTPTTGTIAVQVNDTAVGAAQAQSSGPIIGHANDSGTGAAQVRTSSTIIGLSNDIGTGAAEVRVSGPISGIATVTSTGASQVRASSTITGLSNDAGTAAAQARAAGATAARGATTAAGASIATTTAAAAGAASGAGVGAALVAAVGSIISSAGDQAQGASLDATKGTIDGIAACNGYAGGNVLATGASGGQSSSAGAASAGLLIRGTINGIAASGGQGSSAFKAQSAIAGISASQGASDKIVSIFSQGTSAGTASINAVVGAIAVALGSNGGHASVTANTVVVISGQSSGAVVLMS